MSDRARSWRVTGWVTALLLAVTGITVVASTATADDDTHRDRTTVVDGTGGLLRIVPKNNCRRDTPNIKFGICYRTGDGKVTWLGSLVNPRGRIFYCIDKNLSPKLPANAPVVSTNGLTNQFGKKIGKKEISAVNNLISTWGKTHSDRRAMAIHTILREVMHDTRGQLPGPLKVGQAVKKPSGSNPASPGRQAVRPQGIRIRRGWIPAAPDPAHALSWSKTAELKSAPLDRPQQWVALFGSRFAGRPARTGMSYETPRNWR